MSAQDMLNKFSDGSCHPFLVRDLAFIIFDETSKNIKEMPEKYKKYLEVSSLLHDIGYCIDNKAHNKHSMKMIMEHGLVGFNDIEEKIIACICRYHRGGLPDKKEHEIYNTLDKKERKIVKKLAGILKIADGLATEKQNLIKNITINYNKEDKIAEFILMPCVKEFLPDITTAIRKRDLYEIAFKCQSVLRFAD
ncbi:HD domain-containing protein [bacterium]|nr:HD domain-containing protein [bacterium]